MRSRISGIKSVFQNNRWLVHVAVAVAYALACFMVQTISMRQGPFTFPFRVVCLLLVPRRYWAAMAIGELVPVMHLSAAHMQEFGIVWAVLTSMTPIAFAMPAVAWFLQGGGLFPNGRFVDMRRLWCCLVAASLLWALRTYGIAMTARLPNGPYVVPSGAMLMIFANSYLGLLIFVPWVVMVRLLGRKETWRLPAWRTWLSRPWARDALIATLAIIALASLANMFGWVSKLIIVMVLFSPAVWITVKHGWRASVFGSTLVWLAVAWLWTWKVGDVDVQQLRWLVIVLITWLFMFGVRISEQSQQHQQLELTAQDRQRVAKHAVLRSEGRLSQSSQALECTVGMLQLDYNALIDQFVPEQYRAEYRKQAQKLREQVTRLAESLSPSAWRNRGIAAALNETVGGVLYEGGIAYECDASRRSLETLSVVLQAAIYRVSGEAMAVLSESYLCRHIDLTVRTLWRQRTRWVVLRIDSTEDESHIARALQHAQERLRIGAKLGATMHGFEEVRQFVRVFDGTLRMRRFGDGMRVSVLLREGSEIGSRDWKRPIRWLVR
jgi:hypothetical protein